MPRLTQSDAAGEVRRLADQLTHRQHDKGILMLSRKPGGVLLTSTLSVLNLSGQFSFLLGRQLTRSGQLSLFLVRVHDLLGSRSRVRSALEVTSTSATGRSASKRSATASICCGFARPRSALRRVRSSSRSTRCPVYPVAPAIRSCVSPPALTSPMGCVGLSAGQPVELAGILPVEGPGRGR